MTATLSGEVVLSDTDRTILRTALKRSYDNAHRYALHAAQLARPDVKKQMLEEIEDIQRLAVRLGLGLL